MPYEQGIRLLRGVAAQLQVVPQPGAGGVGGQWSVQVQGRLRDFTHSEHQDQTEAHR